MKEPLRLAETCQRTLGGIASACSRTGEDEGVLCPAHRPGGAGRLLRLHPAAQLGVRPLEADAAGRDFPGRTASGEAQPGAAPLSLLLNTV